MCIRDSTRVTHKYLLSGDSQPLCDECKCSLTVKHILLECYDLMDIREKCFTCSSLKELFECWWINNHWFHQRNQFLPSCLVLFVYLEASAIVTASPSGSERGRHFFTLFVLVKQRHSRQTHPELRCFLSLWFAPNRSSTHTLHYTQQCWINNN